MNSLIVSTPKIQLRPCFAAPPLLIGFLFLVLGTGIALISSTVQQDLSNTVLLYSFVVIVGLMLCRATRIMLDDPKLYRLGYFWLIKLCVTLFLLSISWIPELHATASDYSVGYDPLRYYYQAMDLIDNGWLPVVGQNYPGVLYYYGAIFYVFGHNPFIPALINAFITLLGTLFLIKVSYEIKRQRNSRDWVLAFALLIPEILWFDVMTSRETLSAVLILVASFAVGRYIMRTSSVSLSSTILVSGICLIAIAAVRTSMIIPVVVSIALMYVMHNLMVSERNWSHLPLLVLAIVILVIGPIVQNLIGGYDIKYLELLSQVSTFQNNVASRGEGWSEQSIGLLLAPDSFWQSIVYAPPRMVLYLIAPLPNIAFSLSDLLAGRMAAWHSFMVLFSSVLNIIALPYVLAGFVYALRQRKHNPALLVFYITYWVTFFAIAYGNIIIHERYRIMATLLLAACAWFGATSCSKRLIFKMSILWYSSLALGAAFYIGYKWP